MSQQKFINRKQELGFLESKLAGTSHEVIVIYGRRRIGKSELAINFLKGKGIYFLCSTEGDNANIALLQDKLSEFFGDESFKDGKFDDWRKFFSALFTHTKTVEFMKRNRLVLCLDEFQFLIKANNNIPSIFQQIIDMHIKNKNFMLILTGSFISVMQSSVLGINSPLYGRSTGIWQLMPLKFKHLKEFLPGYNIEELMNTWFITGGTPYYILRFEPAIHLWQNIKEKILKKGEILYQEAEVVLNEEFREPRNYKLMLKAISLGNTVLSEIVNTTGLDKSMVSKYLEVLKSAAIIKEEIPVTESPRFKKRQYIISDHYLNFWFRYVYPNMVDLEANLCEDVAVRIKRDFGYYSGKLFELLIEELFKCKELPCFNFTKIGRWWHKDREIDIVALNEQTKDILFCECKWQDNINAEKILAELKEKAEFVEWNNGKRKEHFCIIAKSFKKKLSKKEGICLDLNDIGKTIK